MLKLAPGVVVALPCLNRAATSSATSRDAPSIGGRVDQARGRESAAARGYDGRYRRLRAQAIKEQIACYGRVCPGYDRLPHTAEKFSIDHAIPLSMGGLNELSNFQVLCLGCNQRTGRATMSRLKKTSRS